MRREEKERENSMNGERRREGKRDVRIYRKEKYRLDIL